MKLTFTWRGAIADLALAVMTTAQAGLSVFRRASGKGLTSL